jgi:hypothetical protein
VDAVTEGDETSTRRPGSIESPSAEYARLVVRPNQGTGDSSRMASAKARGMRLGSARTRSHWSGCRANSQIELPMALTVVSSDGMA